jgi:hypothetical protein
MPQSFRRFAYRAVTSSGCAFPDAFHYGLMIFAACPTTPNRLLRSVWALSLSLAATREISLDFFSCRYLDVSVPCVRAPMLILFGIGRHGITRAGLPHSDIPGSKVVCTYPRLFAACRVLHRLLVPRHPPYALSSLTKNLHLTTGGLWFNCISFFPLQSLHLMLSKNNVHLKSV